MNALNDGSGISNILTDIFMCSLVDLATCLLILCYGLLKMLKRWRKSRQIRQAQMNFQNDECIDIPLMAGLLLTITPTREWYVLPRSTHWAQFLFSSYHFLDCQFTSNFRMSRQSFYSLHRLLQPYIQKEKTYFRETIPSARHLAIFLYHAALGVPYLTVSN